MNYPYRYTYMGWPICVWEIYTYGTEHHDSTNITINDMILMHNPRSAKKAGLMGSSQPFTDPTKIIFNAGFLYASSCCTKYISKAKGSCVVVTNIAAALWCMGCVDMCTYIL